MAMRRLAPIVVTALIMVLSAGGGCSVPVQSPVVTAEVAVETVLEVALGSDPQALGVDMPEGAEHRIPAAYAVTKDAVLILDTLKCRVAEYRGARLAIAVAVPGLTEGQSLAVDSAGDWYVLDAVGDAVIHLDSSGRVKSTCRVPSNIRQRGAPLVRPNGSGEVVLSLNMDEYRRFALEPDGRAIRAWLDMAGFEDYSEMPVVLGGDGELYRLGFNREGGVLQRLQLQVRE